MLSELTIRRFRGIRELRLTDLSFANVFIGSNGAGKTTLLEAIAIAGGPVNPHYPTVLSQWRGLPAVTRTADDGLRSLFYDLSTDRPIELSWVDDAVPCGLTITASTAVGTFGVGDGSAGLSTQPPDRLGGIEYRYARGTDPPMTAKLVTTADGFRIDGVDQSTAAGTGLGAFFMHARRSTSVHETAAALTTAAENRTEEAIYRAVQKVDPRVKRLYAGYRDLAPVILADIGLPRLVPAYVLGDGFARVLLMATGALQSAVQMLLVDDIDSGLHGSVMASTWQTLKDLRDHRPFQLFCTTHNDEMLQSTLEAFKDDPDLLRVFRIDRHHDDRVTVQPYDFDLLRDVSAAGMDIR